MITVGEVPVPAPMNRLTNIFAEVVELVDTTDSKSVPGDTG